MVPTLTASFAPDAGASPGRAAPGTSAGGGKPRLAIAVGLGWGVRNYLLSDTLGVLQRHFDVLIVSPYAGLPDFRDHFQALGAGVAPCPEGPPPLVARQLFKLAETAFYYRSKTAGHRMKLRVAEEQGAHRVVRLAMRMAGPPLFPALRGAFRHWAARRWGAVARLKDLFVREGVDALFSTNCCEQTEWPAVLAARALGLPVATALTSWDNPSTKRFLVSDYDGYLAWSPEMRDHLVQHMEVRQPERIHLTGAPQFDFYFKPEYQLSREEFCRLYHLDPRRKIVVYSTVTPGIMPDEPEIIRQVHDLWERDLPGDPQLLVRLHPKDRLERYQHLVQDPRRRDIVWTLAGSPRISKKDQWCPDRQDLVRAVNTVRHGDVNVHCRYSTMMLDFSALDKPVVVIAYDSQGSTARAREYEQYEHLKPVVQSGAIRIAYLPEETERHLRLGLEAPATDREARARLVKYELGDLDGRAGERAGRAVVDIVTAALRRRAGRAA
jgi:hypothetical protein